MQHIQTFENFINEAKLNTLTLNDNDVKSIWDQLLKMDIKEGDTDNKSMRKDWETLKKTKGASIDKIEIFTRSTDSNLILISFDVFPLKSKEREDYFKIAAPQGIYVYANWENGKIEGPAFKNAWKMSNGERAKYAQAWFNSSQKVF